jgi:hypothetical protein
MRLVASSYSRSEKRFRSEFDIEGYPGWRFVARIAETDAGLQVDRLVIEPSGKVAPFGGITTRMLREIRTGAIIASARMTGRVLASYLPDGAPDLSVSERVGRRGRDDRFYARWAAEYVAACARSTRPVADLAARHHLSPSQVRNLVHACRHKRGMLTDPLPGKAGGELTDRAIELLKEG